MQYIKNQWGVSVRILYVDAVLDRQKFLNLQGRIDKHGFGACKSMLSSANTHSLSVWISAERAAGCCLRLG